MDDRAFGEWLVRGGMLSPDDLRRAQAAQLGRQGRLDTELLDLQLMSEKPLLEALGRFYKTRTVTGSQLASASPTALRMITSRIATRLGIVPFRLEGKTLSVATLTPGDLLIEDEIAQQTGCMVASFITLEILFTEALYRHYQAPITLRYVGLIRRLAGKRGALPAPSPRRPPVDDPEIRAQAVVEAIGNQVLEESPPRAPAAAEQMVLSDEDLDSFPSLRQAAEEADNGIDSTAAAEARRNGALAAIPAPEDPVAAAAGLGPEDLLAAAALALQNAEMRDDIADAVLGFCAPIFRRRMMLVVRRDTIMGWRGEGVGVDRAAVRAIAIPTDEPSVFSGLLQGVEFWLGPLPSMPRNADVFTALGQARPRDCYILPVRLKTKVVCFFYGDNLEDGVGGLPIGELKRLGAKASVAFQVYLMKGKIRTL